MLSTILFALAGNLCFSIASLAFTEYARRVTPLWMNATKALVALIALTLTVPLIGLTVWHWHLGLVLAASGMLVLCVGDLFMLFAMRELGSSRMVMMFGLTPFLTGAGSWLLFGSGLSLASWVGVTLMVACLFCLSLERYRSSGRWQLRGLLLGLLAVVLDAGGLILTKRCFMEWPELHPVQANFFRAVGAGVGFLLMNQFYRPVELRRHFAALSGREAAYVVTASLLGTYVSLLFFFKAMSLGHLSVVSSVAGTGPLFAEAILSVRTRTRPTLLWFLALGFMSVGFALFGLGG